MRPSGNSAKFSCIAGLGAAIIMGFAAPAGAAQLILNGGFEGGSTPDAGGGNVPTDWTPNSAYSSYPFGQVQSYNVYDGSYSLQIGNFDYEPLATLSQTFTDVSGSSYSGQIWVYYPYTDASAFFQVLVDGTSMVDISGATSVSAWTEYTFSFTGTGSDTLTIEAQTNPAEWYADDVSVAGNVGTTPLPAALPLFASGLGAMGLFGWGRKRKSAATIAA